MFTSRALTASTSLARRGLEGGNEGAGERRREEEVGKGETASQRGEKAEVGPEVGNMLPTSRPARFLESQVIKKLVSVLCRRFPNILKHYVPMTIKSNGDF